MDYDDLQQLDSGYIGESYGNVNDDNGVFEDNLYEDDSLHSGGSAFSVGHHLRPPNPHHGPAARRSFSLAAALCCTVGGLVVLGSTAGIWIAWQKGMFDGAADDSSGRGSGLDPFGGEGIPMLPSDFDTLGCDSGQKKRLEGAHLAVSSKLSAVLLDLSNRAVDRSMLRRFEDCFGERKTNCGTFICSAADSAICDESTSPEPGALVFNHRESDNEKTFFCMDDITETKDDCMLQELMAASLASTQSVAAFSETRIYSDGAEDDADLAAVRVTVRDYC